MTRNTADNEFRFQPPEVRQRQILDAAVTLAVEHGFENVSIATVAEKAGIAKGTIYLHYDSRQALATALQADLWERMLNEPRAIVARNELTATEKLDEVISSLVRYEADNQELHHELFHLVGGSHDTTHDPWHGLRELVISILEQGAASGEFDIPDPRVTADFILHAYAGPSHGDHGQDTHQITKIVQELVQRVVHAK